MCNRIAVLNYRHQNLVGCAHKAISFVCGNKSSESESYLGESKYLIIITFQGQRS